MKIPTLFLLLGGKIDYVRKDWGHFYQITAVAYYHVSDMISGGGLMKSFAGFLRVVVVRWLSKRTLVEVVVRNFWQSNWNAGGGVGPRLRSVTAWERYQTTPLGICKRLACS